MIFVMIEKKLTTRFLSVVLGLAAVVMVSCDRLVLEDRSECPAFLFFEITNPDPFDVSDYVHVAAFVYPEETLLNKDTTTVREIQNKDFYLEVKRSHSILGYGVTGYDKCRLVGETDWVVDEGSDYGRVWRFDFRSDAFGERFYIPVEMVKDHSNIEIYFENFDMIPGTDGNFPYDIVVRSNTCGINALTGDPVKGPFLYVPREMPGGTFKFTVPRQFDRSLVIQVFNKEEYFGNDDFVTEFNVWNWANNMDDFSWRDKNLSDIRIVVELATSNYYVSIVPWWGDDGGYEYEY